MSGTGPSPLGRYSGPDDGSGTVVEVRLLGVPVRVLAASREHHDGLMREFRLLALSGGLPGGKAPARLVELTHVLGERFAAARARPDAEVDTALDRGEATVDLVYVVPAAAAAAARQLEALMREADEFCRDEQLMTLARSPVLRAFADWYLAQFVDQIAGQPARAWDGPLDPD